MPSIVVASQELGRTPNYGDLFLERLFHSFSVARDFSVIENCWHRHGAVYLVNGGFFAGWAISRCLIVNPSHSKWSQKAFLFYIQLNSHGDVNRLKGVTRLSEGNPVLHRAQKHFLIHCCFFVTSTNYFRFRWK